MSIHLSSLVAFVLLVVPGCKEPPSAKEPASDRDTPGTNVLSLNDEISMSGVTVVGPGAASSAESVEQALVKVLAKKPSVSIRPAPSTTGLVLLGVASALAKSTASADWQYADKENKWQSLGVTPTAGDAPPPSPRISMLMRAGGAVLVWANHETTVEEVPVRSVVSAIKKHASWQQALTHGRVEIGLEDGATYEHFVSLARQLVAVGVRSPHVVSPADLSSRPGVPNHTPGVQPTSSRRLGRLKLDEGGPAPAAPKVSVEVDVSVPSESLSRGDLKAAIMAKKSQLASCYQRQLQRTPGLAGSVTIKLRIKSSGRGSAIGRDTVGPMALVANCATRKLYRFSTPALTGDGSAIKAEATLRFRPL